MEFLIKYNDIRMHFDVDAAGKLNLRRIALDDSEPADKISYRAAVELGSGPGYGSWDKKISTEAKSLCYVGHRDYPADGGSKLEIELADERFKVTLNYRFYDKINAFRAWTTVRNISGKSEGLSFVSSFNYNGFEKGNCGDIMICHNGWCQEAIAKFYPPLELGLAQLGGTTSKKVVVGNTGTFTTKDYLPIGYMNGMFWQIEHNGAWRYEISDCNQNLYVSLSGPTEENGWYKSLAPDEVFESAMCAVSLGEDFASSFAEITKYRRVIKGINPEFCKQPVVFNDFMHCIRTNPHTDTEKEMIGWAAEAGAEYYCVDAGWYADGGWWDNVGEWLPAKERFSNGLGEIFDFIRSKGLIPGIWLEPEVMGINCPLAKIYPDGCFYMRHGKRVVNRQRFQLDYRNPIVLDHMNETVERLIADFGIGYFKFDYNIDAGIGTETDADSFGDGSEKCRASLLNWIDGLIERHPNVIFENCASGGMRMNYELLSRFHIQSTSDNESFLHTSAIASNVTLGVLPEQAGIWVCPLPDMDRNKLIFTLVNGMAGAFYLAGRPNELGDRFGLLSEAVEVYKSYRAQIKDFIPFWPLGFNSFAGKVRCIAYKSGGKTYLFLWQTEGSGDISIPIAAKDCRCIFPRENSYKIRTGEELHIDLGDSLAAGVFVIE